MDLQLNTENDDNVGIWIEVNLKINFYEPEQLEKGMWFINSLYPGTDKEFVEIWELEQDIPNDIYESKLAEIGYPVEILLTLEMINPDELDEIIVYFENFGWFYDIDFEEFEIVDLIKINNIIQDYNCKVFLLVNQNLYENHNEIVPELKDDLVIITYLFEEEFEEE